MFRLQHNLFIETHVKGTSKTASQTDRKLTKDLSMLCDSDSLFSRAHMGPLCLTLTPAEASSFHPSPETGKSHAAGWQRGPQTIPGIFLRASQSQGTDAFHSASIVAG